jgi:hypothetical protein
LSTRVSNPGELPLEQPIRYYLAVNPKAAEMLGAMISQSMLVRAER